MIDDPISESPFPASGASAGAGTATTGLGGMGLAGGAAEVDAQGRVQRVAQKAHEAVDRMEQAIGVGSERMMDWQQEWSESAREQVRASPLAAVGVAFVAGILFNKLFMR
ncbi:hypothetical protein ACT80S_05675 [Ramlibacter sp. MAHUQ-53]|uniref:hypothetical protein n=1 Tax=unclassified Ramlibacter TaxID=2617605 RepID=UPI003631D6CF